MKTLCTITPPPTDKVVELAKRLSERFGNQVLCKTAFNEVTLLVDKKDLLSICRALRDEDNFKFDMLMDVCGIDYLYYGVSEWQTQEASGTGFSRGRESEPKTYKGPRFAVAYHLLSVSLNQRVRIRTFVGDEVPQVDSVVDIWNSANWFEREAFDLYGILFNNHPDLRRILTDYGFVGHPFRKDFPLSGHVEMRYDAFEGRVVYEPVDIVPRTLVPKVIRDGVHE